MTVTETSGAVELFAVSMDTAAGLGVRIIVVSIAIGGAVAEGQAHECTGSGGVNSTVHNTRAHLTLVNAHFLEPGQTVAPDQVVMWHNC